MRSRRWSFIIVALTSLLSASCGRELDFYRDERVSITHPNENDTITLPLEVSWTAEDVEAQFAVFIDRSPMRPGQHLRSLVPRDDELCRADPGCPDLDWLAARGVYLTDDTELVIPSVPDRRSSDHQPDRHEVTIVLLDSDGRRLGESAFIREFLVDRED